ncbi:hypothetical protein AX774_g3038 [Zancudomyces culisetae]|uniref:Uncharacterized protein n=1 Tax=Zancudomyces culisetae TaxID=1213189 RepID=A0A1R1PRC8_ZANCU|nr:hypothetical protein AX774_g3038 [Zancudomyces culisetae]|eukprot:OMH83452.1 hypothetical protein AX774_g3038 [Zancudomyces culisetae]
MTLHINNCLDLQQEELTQQIKILRQKSQLAIREAVKSNEKQKENTTGNVTGGVILQEQRHTGRVCTAVEKRSSFDATEWDEQENQTSSVTKRAKMCSPNMGLKGSCESDGFFAGDHFVQHKQRHDRCDSLTTINGIGVNARVDKYKYKVEVVISKRRGNSGSRRRAKKVICSSDFSDDLSELEGAEPSKNIPQLDKDTEPVILDEYSGEKNENTIPKMDINDSSTITTELERPFENIQNAQDQVILSEKMDHEELEMVVNDAGNTIKILEMNEKDRNDGNSNQEFISDMDAEEVQRELAKAVSWHRSTTISEVNSKQGVGGGINMSGRCVQLW